MYTTQHTCKATVRDIATTPTDYNVQRNKKDRKEKGERKKACQIRRGSDTKPKVWIVRG